LKKSNSLGKIQLRQVSDVMEIDNFFIQNDPKEDKFFLDQLLEFHGASEELKQILKPLESYNKFIHEYENNFDAFGVNEELLGFYSYYQEGIFFFKKKLIFKDENINKMIHYWEEKMQNFWLVNKNSPQNTSKIQKFIINRMYFFF